MTREEMRRPVDRAAPGADKSGQPALILAIIVGLVGVVCICFFVHSYETVIFENGELYATVFHALTPIVFFLVFLVVLAVGALCYLFTAGAMPKTAMWYLG